MRSICQHTDFFSTYLSKLRVTATLLSKDALCNSLCMFKVLHNHIYCFTETWSLPHHNTEQAKPHMRAQFLAHISISNSSQDSGMHIYIYKMQAVFTSIHHYDAAPPPVPARYAFENSPCLNSPSTIWSFELPGLFPKGADAFNIVLSLFFWSFRNSLWILFYVLIN